MGYYTKHCNISEDFSLHHHQCGNLKSCTIWFCKEFCLTYPDISQIAMCPHICDGVVIRRSSSIFCEKWKLSCRGIKQIKT